jgi:hypothetical protein
MLPSRFMVTLKRAIVGLTSALATIVLVGCSSGSSGSSKGGKADASTSGSGGSGPDASESGGGTTAGGNGGANIGGGTSSGGSGGSGLADCNGDGVPETTLGTVTDCAACGDKCDPENGTGRCTARKCEIAACAAGFGDCDKVVTNGCEADLTDQHTCGKCGTDCGAADGGVSCVNGACQIVKCPKGFDDCNNNPADGCETPLTTVTDCGACGNPCTVQNGTPSCETGVCEVACKTRCTSTGTDAGVTCRPGDCVDSQCSAGFGDCDGDPTNGCERNTDTSLGHCGKCNNPCNYVHASETCVAGACTFGTCDPGWADCVNGTADGCETSLAGTPDPANPNTILHCGGCNTTCSYSNAGALCVPGAGNTFACQLNGCLSGQFTTSDTTGSCACTLVNNVNAAATCSEAPTVAIGATSSQTFSGNEPDLQSDWYHFTFPGVNDSKGAREYQSIVISTTGSFKLEVKDSACAIGAQFNTCSGSEANDPTAVQTWEWNDPCNVATAAGANASTECTNLINGTSYRAAPTEVWVRVYSTAATAACTQYVLSVVRGAI